jgi:hypothetical protein
MRVTIAGPARAIDLTLGGEIVDPETLRTLHGLKTEETCVDYFDDPLGEIGLTGGHLQIVFDETSKQLQICTVYHTPRRLKQAELRQLVQDTRGQWSDGIGENGIETGNANIEIDLDPGWMCPVAELKIEQLDDGFKVAKPRPSPLFAAVKKDDVARIATLLQDGEDVDARDRFQKTPLCYAVEENKIEAARLLIEHGATLNLAGIKSSFTPLTCAASSGHVEILKLMLEAGADPNFYDPAFEYFPLQMACSGRKQPEAARLLVEYGADVNQACNSGYTPLLYLKVEDIELARFLIEKGADTEVKNFMGEGMNATLRAALT